MAQHELLDLVDAQGNMTGERRDKAEIHSKGLWHRDVHVWITDGAQLLQQQRAWDKKIMPGAWDIAVGGHVGAGETFLEAAMRETEEELGLRLPAERFLAAGKLAVELEMEPGPNAWMHRTFGDNFVVVEHGLDIATLHPEAGEVIGTRWYPIDQLEADLRSPDTITRHAPQPLKLWALGIAAVRAVTQMG